MIPPLFFMRKLAFSLCLMLIPFQSMADTISPSNAHIQYHGRFDFDNPEAPAFNWSGSAISAQFSGGSIGIRLRDGYGDYDVWIDGVHHSVLITEQGVTDYPLADGLDAGQNHTLKISRRNEEHFNKAEFLGFTVDDGQSLSALPPESKPRIEFIGDSYTVGYGNESPSRTCSGEELRQYTNTNRSFPTLIGEALGADYTILGWSGAGMVRNYGDANSTSSESYSTYYGNTLGGIESPWDFSQNIPDLVVICLGTNDFSTEPKPSEADYKTGYKAFINRVKGYYPQSKILCVATHVGPNPTYVRAIVEEANQDFPGDIFYSQFPETGLDFMGCDWHPSVKDDSLIAEALLTDIQAIEGWSTPVSPPGRQGKRGVVSQPTSTESHNSGWVTPWYTYETDDNRTHRVNSLGVGE